MKKLLFFDIDGTLIDDNRELPHSVIPALKTARERDCLIFLNTGRTLCNMDPRLKTLPLDGMVLGCGTRIICQGETLKALEYTLQDSLRIRKIINDLQIPAVYECDTGMYFDPEGTSYPAIDHFRQFSDNAGIYREIREQDPEFRAVKMFCFSDRPETITGMLHGLEKAGYAYSAIDRGGAGWEIVPAGCSKAQGIEFIRERMKVPLSACYAFGDSANDLPMLDYVPNSIAMGNAPPDVQARCALVTDRPENDGIRNALIRLGILDETNQPA